MYMLESSHKQKKKAKKGKSLLIKVSKNRKEMSRTLKTREAASCPYTIFHYESI